MKKLLLPLGLIKNLTFSIAFTLTAVLLTAQAQAGTCKVDLLNIKEVEVRKPARAFDEAGKEVLAEVVTEFITFGAGKLVNAGLKSTVASYRMASQSGSQGFVMGKKAVGKAAEEGIEFGIEGLITYFDDINRSPDDLIVRAGGNVAVSTTSLPYINFATNQIVDTIYPNHTSSFFGSFNLQLIEYDSLSANDNLGTVYGKDQNMLTGQLSPLNQESLEIMMGGEEGSHYRVDYEIIPGAGNLEAVPERLFCNTDECQNAREGYPSDYYFGYPYLSQMKECPDGYTDAGGTYIGGANYGSFGPWYRVCELHTPDCGEPFKRLKDIGGVSALKDGDVIVLRGRTTHQKAETVNPDFCDNLTDTCEPRTYHKYLSNSKGNGQYLGVCTDCTPSGIPNAGLYYMDRDRTVTHWTVKKMVGGKIALQGSNGQYLARCQGCAGMSQAAYVHVTDPNGAYAQFTIAESPTPSGDFIYTLQSDIAAYLSGCLGCGDMDDYKLGFGYAGSFHIYDANNDSAKWSIGVKQAGWDTDLDGVIDPEDAFPNDITEWLDSDGDGIGDNTDAFPFNPSESADSDGDGLANNTDPCPNDPEGIVDTDGDGVCDDKDLFPNDINSSTDADGDGISDFFDRFPFDPTESDDSDGDGVGDNTDAFPYDYYDIRHIEVDSSNGWVIGYVGFADPFSSPTPAEVVKQDWPVYFDLREGVSGSTARVTFTYENPIDPGAVLFKIMCSAISCLDVGLPEDSYYITNQSLLIEGNKITVIFQDSGITDEDGLANGVIENAMLNAPWVPVLLADGTSLVGHDLIKPTTASDDEDTPEDEAASGTGDEVTDVVADGAAEVAADGGGVILAMNFWFFLMLLLGLSGRKSITLTNN